jgi:hypothetical protein
MTYEEKLAIANKYLKKFLVEWDDLGDINSLHDVNDNNGVIRLCNERLRWLSYPIDEN